MLRLTHSVSLSQPSCYSISRMRYLLFLAIAALASAAKLLKPGGQILILDLLKHNFEKAKDLYGDRWLGFAESDLHRWLEAAGFKKIEISIVAAEEQPPHFQTILASGEK